MHRSGIQFCTRCWIYNCAPHFFNCCQVGWNVVYTSLHLTVLKQRRQQHRVHSSPREMANSVAEWSLLRQQRMDTVQTLLFRSAMALKAQIQCISSKTRQFMTAKMELLRLFVCNSNGRNRSGKAMASWRLATTGNLLWYAHWIHLMKNKFQTRNITFKRMEALKGMEIRASEAMAEVNVSVQHCCNKDANKNRTGAWVLATRSCCGKTARKDRRPRWFLIEADANRVINIWKRSAGAKMACQQILITNTICNTDNIILIRILSDQMMVSYRKKGLFCLLSTDFFALFIFKLEFILNSQFIVETVNIK